MRKLRAYRQGDVIIRELLETPIPDEVTNNLVENEYVIPSETGKPHRIIAEQILVSKINSEIVTIVSPDKEVVLEHPEHGKMVIPKGTYSVERVREATSNTFSGAYRNVRD
jgi:hypothetical protein